MLLKSRFSQPTCRCQYCEKVPQMNSTPPLVWLEGRNCVLFGVAAFSTFYVIVVWMLICDGLRRNGGIRRWLHLLLVQYGIVGLRVYFCRITEKWFAHLGQCFSMPGWRHSPLRQFTCYPLRLICNAGAFVIGFPCWRYFTIRCIGNVEFSLGKAKVTGIYMMMGA